MPLEESQHLDRQQDFGVENFLIISSRTQLCGVMGDPIEHSLSPVMHNSAFQKLGLDCVYLAFRVPKESLEFAMVGVVGLGVLGINVTIPHKSAVMRFLDHVDENALLIGAVNTVVNRDGELTGYNTDSTGSLRALEHAGVELQGKRIALLGAGGAARAIAFMLSDSAESITILNRTESRAASLSDSLKKSREIKVNVKKLCDESVRRTLSEADILINATPIGMWPHIDASPVGKEFLRRDLTVFDLVYNPIETRLLRDAHENGCRIVDGVDMLVYQGAASFELWTGEQAPVLTMRKAVLEALRREVS